MLFHVFAHVDTGKRPVIVKKEVRKGARQFGFTHTGRPDTEEAAERTVGVGKSCTVPSDGIGNRLYCLILSDNPFLQYSFQIEILLLLARQHLCNGNSRPHRNNFRDILFGHLFAEELPTAAGLFCKLRSNGGNLFFQLRYASVFQLGSLIQIAVACKLRFFTAELLKLFLIFP